MVLPKPIQAMHSSPGPHRKVRNARHPAGGKGVKCQVCQSLRTHAGQTLCKGYQQCHLHEFQLHLQYLISITSKIKVGPFGSNKEVQKLCVKIKFKKKTVAQTFSVHGAPKNPNSRASSSNGTLVITEVNQWKNPPPLVFPMNFDCWTLHLLHGWCLTCFTMHFVDFNNLRSPPQMASHHRPRSRSNDPTEPTNTIAMGISPWEKLTESTWQNNHWKYHHQTTQEMWVPNGALPA